MQKVERHEECLAAASELERLGLERNGWQPLTPQVYFFVSLKVSLPVFYKLQALLSID